jgi:hypothetical protein
MSQFDRSCVFRPVGPKSGSGARLGTPARAIEYAALECVRRHPEAPRYVVAERSGMKPSLLSRLICWLLGCDYLASVIVIDLGEPEAPPFPNINPACKQLESSEEVLKRLGYIPLKVQ